MKEFFNQSAVCLEKEMMNDCIKAYGWIKKRHIINYIGKWRHQTKYKSSYEPSIIKISSQKLFECIVT